MDPKRDHNFDSHPYGSNYDPKESGLRELWETRRESWVAVEENHSPLYQKVAHYGDNNIASNYRPLKASVTSSGTSQGLAGEPSQVAHNNGPVYPK